ncbi:MAG TPA: hypothetical protein VFU76_16225 [Terriglobales bacterium]|nr:hypothetical protein [Terriglobales bacterium]
MRRIAVLLLLASVAAAAADKSETLDALKERVAAAKPGKDRIELCVKVAQREMKEADHLFDAGDTAKAQAAVQDIVTYGLRAIAEAKETRKRMKQTEIAVRKLTEHMNDLGKTLAYDDRAPVAAAVKKLDTARSDLLAAMFKR